MRSLLFFVPIVSLNGSFTDIPKQVHLPQSQCLRTDNTQILRMFLSWGSVEKKRRLPYICVQLSFSKVVCFIALELADAPPSQCHNPGFKSRKTPCLVPRPKYFAGVNLLGSIDCKVPIVLQNLQPTNKMIAWLHARWLQKRIKDLLLCKETTWDWKIPFQSRDKGATWDGTRNKENNIFCLVLRQSILIVLLTIYFVNLVRFS